MLPFWTEWSTGSHCGETPLVEATQAAVEEVKSQFALPGTAWELESMGEAEESLPVIEDTRPTANFLVSRYTDPGSCNWFMGEYTAKNETLTMYNPARTSSYIWAPAVPVFCVTVDMRC